MARRKQTARRTDAPSGSSPASGIPRPINRKDNKKDEEEEPPRYDRERDRDAPEAELLPEREPCAPKPPAAGPSARWFPNQHYSVYHCAECGGRMENGSYRAFTYCEEPACGEMIKLCGEPVAVCDLETGEWRDGKVSVCRAAYEARRQKHKCFFHKEVTGTVVVVSQKDGARGWVV